MSAGSSLGEQIDGNPAPSVAAFFEDPGRAFTVSQWTSNAMDRVWVYGTSWVNFPALNIWFGNNDAFFTLSSFLELGKKTTHLFRNGDEGPLAYVSHGFIYSVGMVNKVAQILPKIGFLKFYAEGMKKIGGYAGVVYYTGMAVEEGWQGNYFDCIQSTALAVVNAIGLAFASNHQFSILGVAISAGGVQFLFVTCCVATFVCRYIFSAPSASEDSSEEAESENFWKILQESSTDFLTVSGWLVALGKQVKEYGEYSDFIDLDQASTWISHVNALKGVPKLIEGGNQLVDCFQSDENMSISWGAQLALKMIETSHKITKLVLSMGQLERLNHAYIKNAKRMLGATLYSHRTCQNFQKGEWTKVPKNVSLLAINVLDFIKHSWVKCHLDSLKFAATTVVFLSYVYGRLYKKPLPKDDHVEDAGFNEEAGSGACTSHEAFSRN